MKLKEIVTLKDCFGKHTIYSYEGDVDLTVIDPKFVEKYGAENAWLTIGVERPCREITSVFVGNIQGKGTSSDDTAGTSGFMIIDEL